MKSIPDHLGIIPDGNRRWAQENNLLKEAGYAYGLDPGLQLFRLCKEIGIKELTFYGFTKDNTKRPAAQVQAFQHACVKAVELLYKEGGADLLVIGDTKSALFPKELLPFTKRKKSGSKTMRLNFLVNYGWEWDLSAHYRTGVNHLSFKQNFTKTIQSSDIPRIDLIIRWGGCRRLSGFLPIQSVYADFYVINDYWPEFKEKHLYDALEWYKHQDATLGG